MVVKQDNYIRKHSRWNNYIRKQQTLEYIGQLFQDTVDGTNTLEHIRQDGCQTR